MYNKLYNIKPDGIVLIASPKACFARKILFDAFENEVTKEPLRLLNMKYVFMDRSVKYRGFSMTIGIKKVHETCSLFKQFFFEKFLDRYICKKNASWSVWQIQFDLNKNPMQYGMFVGSSLQVKKIMKNPDLSKLTKLEKFLPVESETPNHGIFIFYKKTNRNTVRWKYIRINFKI